MQDHEGNEISNRYGLCHLTKKYFQELFTSRVGEYQPILSLAQPRISGDHNNMLLRPFSLDESTTAMMRINGVNF